MRRAEIKRPQKPGGVRYSDAITLSDAELQNMTEQEINEFLAAKAQQYADFVNQRSAVSEGE